MFDGLDELEWKGGAKVRWARVKNKEGGDTLLLRLNEITSQTRIYKQTLDLFFRRDFREWRPRYGDFAVEILVEVREGLPPIDLDNIAKAVLDGIKGAVFFDDAQVARLLVERAHAPMERLTISVRPLTSSGTHPD